MTPETSPLRCNWRSHPRPASRQQEQIAPPMFGPFIYDAYGTQRDEDGELPIGEDFAEGTLFQGMRHDPEQAAFFMGQGRHFSPTLKAWTEDEPCGYVEGLNLYASPIDDPSNL